MSPDQAPVDQPVAILFGSELEGGGTSPTIGRCFVTVPMRGLTESLNVSVAAACILQRVTERRRRFIGGGDLALSDKKRSMRHGWIEKTWPDVECRRAQDSVHEAVSVVRSSGAHS